MTRLELQIHDDVIASLNKIEEINDSGIELVIPEGSILFENILNLKLLNQQAVKLGKTIQFETIDELGSNLISMLDDSQTLAIPPQKQARFTVPKITIPKFSLAGMKMPKIKFGFNILT